eukprot:s1_g1211.t1
MRFEGFVRGEMNERDQQILDAALSVFLRYGVKRSSMSDIAKEANVARQTLYNAFASKDDVLCAMIRLFSERSLARIGAELEPDMSLDSQLSVIFQHTVIAPYERLHESPNAADFIEGCNQAAKEEIAAQDEQIRLMIESLLKPYGSLLKQNGVSAKQLSDFIQRSSSAAKHSATDRRHLNALLKTLTVMVMQTLGTTPATPRA